MLFVADGHCVGADNKPVDLSSRDPEIHWPKLSEASTAPVFSHNEELILTDCHHVWTTFTNVLEGPSWFVLVKNVCIDALDRTLKQESLLRLIFFGTPITARIDEPVPETRLSWTPQALEERAPSHYHTWRFLPEAAGCRVETEESGIGPNDLKAPNASSRFMHRVTTFGSHLFDGQLKN